ncbi:hypothetical protein FOPG_19934 [Fusarium oxysporum f. sp. conglutinans race 2 54008]|uniref:Uncharacterized protein n=1 Tax=Fusarium oxysporum f. sp. conglutinans race 2 54008 TaxID=1089457 RepID=X0GKH9_FUSOX|nr:hypothetical protein FOPG_19934 [Fusarium oxysporum f. sp. conglutinans race 2 54008]
MATPFSMFSSHSKPLMTAALALATTQHILRAPFSPIIEMAISQKTSKAKIKLNRLMAFSVISATTFVSLLPRTHQPINIQ